MMAEETVKSSSPGNKGQQQYLKTYVDRLINSKVRIQALLAEYGTNLVTLREHNIDQNDLIKEMLVKYEGQDAPQILIAQEQVKKNLETLDLIEQRIRELEGTHNQITDDLQIYLRELTDLEMEIGNFIAHIFAIRDGVSRDQKDETILLFSPGGSAEVAISTSSTKWKDSSQVKLTRKEN